ncbi:MAG: UDP-N-acetylmuramoyl-tripeptide--D-alanyl-D-alanine ligase [Desulfarculales bacterium]|jgi:UDP-N-acetylmuramoyl-tripeptide--D-alanyl-D-alanine ligase|nr:UDP-N-acetylmuramoyl-tripeptide--D-alanyl-D-alanine ligase [Desulfarculales bacterium]
MFTLDWARRQLGLSGHEGEGAQISGVNTDSRTLAPGQLFVALAGVNFDGHDFVAQAARAGAGAALVNKNFIFADKEFPLLKVDDTLRALGDLAAAWRREHSLRVLALTGSTGKTTAKEMLAAVLSRRYQVLKTEGNFNNLIGLPLTLLRLDETHNAAVLEMGMSVSGEIARLTRIADPDVAVITNIGPAHMASMGSVRNIAKAKVELWENMDSAAQAVINIDDPFLKPWRNKLKGRALTFGSGKEAEIYSSQLKVKGVKQNFLLHLPGAQPLEVTLSVPGAHNVCNALAAAAAAFSLGINGEEIAQGLSGYQGIKGRLRLQRAAVGALVLDDTYNANPASMAAALDTLAQMVSVAGEEPRRPVAVLADMLELGPESAGFHYELGRKAALSGCRLLFTYGPEARHTDQGAREAGLAESGNFQELTELKAALKKHLRPGDIVLVKGSNAMGMERVVDFLTEPKIFGPSAVKTGN